MKNVFLLTMSILLSLVGFSQVSNYSYSATTSTWVTNVSPTTLIGNGQDNAISSKTAIGFNFTYDNITYTKYRVSSNGFLTFDTLNVSTQATNNLNTSTERVILAVLWDDNRTGSSGNVNYKLTGTSPNRVLTIEWYRLRWINTNNSGGNISCQIKLYETTNIIEYIYDRSTASFSLDNNPTSSIGLGGSTSGDFLSLSDIKAAPYPTSSSLVETNTIGTSPMGLMSGSVGGNNTSNNFSAGQLTTRIGNGTKYIFSPPVSLPIELLYFRGKSYIYYNQLEWETASENNNDYFTIEKTRDGTYFYNIAIIKGAGNSNQRLYYQYLDRDIEDGINYYILKQTDYDGKFKYSDIISIDNRKEFSAILIKVTNTLGQEVTGELKGIYIFHYSDGTTIKRIF